MNNLSLLLWLSDIVQGIKIVFCLIMAFGGIGIVVLIIGLICSAHDAIGETKGDFHFEEYKYTQKLAFILIPLWFLIAIVAMVTPSKETVLMIAASEAGEQVATSTEGKQIVGKVIQALNVQLDKLSKE